MTAPLFQAGAIRCGEIDAASVPALQRFFEENPQYHRQVSGEPPAANEAAREFEQRPPEGWPFRKRWLLRFADGDAMIGMADVIDGLFAPVVWHIGLFMIATRLHGDGSAQRTYAALESWMQASGAKWLRLGVVETNLRAARFWENLGYRDVRKRTGVQMGNRLQTIRVMAKALAGGRLEEYLALVARDRPEAS